MDKKKIISYAIIIVSLLICIVSVLGILVNNKKKRERGTKLERPSEGLTIEEVTEAETPQYVDKDSEFFSEVFQDKDYEYDNGEERQSKVDEYDDIQYFDHSDRITEEQLYEVGPKMVEETTDFSTKVFNYSGRTEEYENELRNGVDTKFDITVKSFPDRIMNCFDDHHVESKVNEIVICEVVVNDYVPEDNMYSASVRGYANVNLTYDDVKDEKRYVTFEANILHTEGAEPKYFNFKMEHIFKNKIRAAINTDGTHSLNFTGNLENAWNMSDYDPEYYQKSE